MDRNIDLRKENVVVVDNCFIKAKYVKRISINAMRLLRIAISQCKMDDTDFYNYEISVLDFAGLCGIDPSNIYNTIDDVTTELLQTLIIVSNPNSKKGFIKYTLFSECRYIEKEGYIRFEMSPKVKPLFLALKKNFSKIPLGDVLMMKSKYSLKLYEALIMELKNKKIYGNVHERVYISLEDLREMLEATDIYKLVGHFRSRALNPQIEEINNSGIGWHIEVVPAKKGRSIVGFWFDIWSKNGWIVNKKQIKG